MGLFDKKYCSICGEKIGFIGGALGVRDLEDGYLCKECAAKLSPLFSGKKHATVEEIRQQLAYREENRKVVETFRATRVYGGSKKLYLDEDGRRFMVSSGSNLVQSNPDVISFDQVTGCKLNIDESRSEEKKDGPDGKKVSFNPPHYTYSYDFDITITVDHPYFDQVRFRVNDSDVEIRTIGNGLLSVLQANDANYQENLKTAREILRILDKDHEEQREEAEAENAPKTAVICGACGATTIPDEHGCCEYCGSALYK